MPKKNKKKTKVAAPVKSLRGQELAYQRELNKLGKALLKSVREEVLLYLKANQEEYVMDGIGSQLNLIFKKLNANFTGTLVSSFAESTATQVVTKTSKNNEQRFNKTVNRATGVDLGSIISTEGLEDFVELSVSKNVSLIKSLPEEYLKQVETIVNNGVVNGSRYSTIAKQIAAKTGSVNSKLANRIKTIARNEIQTINSQLTLRRSENLGITKGIYRTSEDERVRKCHAELNGVEYDLKKGAWSKSCSKFIQPGITDINCRCSYSPVIEI
jgi:SPP1 gp7 family putative phage head morphogenesis protein